MDWYEKELLARAVEACQQYEGITVWTEVRLSDNADVVFVECNTERGCHQFNSDDSGTIADALTTLLRNLGEPVPERPSAEQIRHARQHLEDYTVDGAETVLDVLRPFGLPIVAALLEGGEA